MPSEKPAARRQLSIDRRAVRLTRREERVLELLAEGLSSAEIASSLAVSTKDIEFHVGNLIAKFLCRNRTGVVARAYVSGYFCPVAWPPAKACDPSKCSCPLEPRSRLAGKPAWTNPPHLE